MYAVLVQIAGLATAALLGSLAGWFIRGNRRGLAPPGNEGCGRPVSVPEASGDGAGELAAAQAFLGRLQQLAESVAADVDVHHDRVLKINDEIVAFAPAELGILGAVKNLIRANETMQSQLSTAEQRLQTQAKDIERYVRESRTDALTKLGNRRAFEDELKRCARLVQRDGQPACLMLIDVDRFKLFNDTYGHHAGDEVLRGIARTLRSVTAPHEVICRHGGEEFAVILAGSTLAAARSKAERVRRSISLEVFEFDGLDLRVTACCGVAEFRPSESVDGVVKRCDDALYAAKHNGRSCGYWHDGTGVHRLDETPACDRENRQPCQPPPSDDAATAGSTSAANGAAQSEADPFHADLTRRVAEWKRGGATVSVVLLELDSVAGIDALFGDAGHEAARQALLTFLKASVREMDHVARLQPDQYAILLSGIPLREAGETAERLRAEIARNGLSIQNRHLPVTVSAGLAEVTHGDEATDLINRAHGSLEAAKTAGGNCCFLASKSDTLVSC